MATKTLPRTPKAPRRAPARAKPRKAAAAPASALSRRRAKAAPRRAAANIHVNGSNGHYGDGHAGNGHAANAFVANGTRATVDDVPWTMLPSELGKPVFAFDRATLPKGLPEYKVRELAELSATIPLTLAGLAAIKVRRAFLMSGEKGQTIEEIRADLRRRWRSGRP